MPGALIGKKITLPGNSRIKLTVLLHQIVTWASILLVAAVSCMFAHDRFQPLTRQPSKVKAVAPWSSFIRRCGVSRGFNYTLIHISRRYSIPAAIIAKPMMAEKDHGFVADYM